MKANVKRPARFSFKTITEKEAKHLTLIFVAVLFLVIVVLALFPLLDREEERYEVTPTPWAATCSKPFTAKTARTRP